MRDLLIAATGPWRATERGFKESQAMHREMHACSVALFSSEVSGNGLSTGFSEYSTITDVPLFVPLPGASEPVFWDGLYEAVCRCRASHWRSDTRLREICGEMERREMETGAVPTLLVDDADFLLKKHALYLECLRYVMDRVRGRLILGSSGPLYKALAAAKPGAGLECLASRTRVRVEIPSPTVNDVKLLARELIPEIEIAGDLAREISERLYVSTRTIIDDLRAAEQTALVAGLTSLNLENYKTLTGRPGAKATAPRVKQIAGGPREARSISV
jgi:hypothetical protein